MKTHWRGGTFGVLLVATLILAACTSQAAPPPTAAPETPAASATPEPTDMPDPSMPSPSEEATASWEPASLPESANASGVVAIAPGGDGLIAIGFDGGFGSMLWTSTDGREWRDLTPDGWEAVGIASVVEWNGMLVAVGRGNTTDVEAQEAAVYLSEDGLTWRQVATTDAMLGQTIDVVATDDALYAVGGVPGEDSAGIWRSTDAETWERTGGNFEHAFMWSITEGGPGLVAVGWRRNPDPDLAVWTSADGAEWTLAPDPEGFEGFEATDVLQTAEGTLVMIGSGMHGSGAMWSSEDGVTWTPAHVEGGMEGTYARSAAVTDAGIIAVGGGDEMAARAWRSTDGLTWQPLGDPLPGAYFSSVTGTDAGILTTGATQAGTLETGIEARAQIWVASFGG